MPLACGYRPNTIRGRVSGKIKAARRVAEHPTGLTLSTDRTGRRACHASYRPAQDHQSYAWPGSLMAVSRSLRFQILRRDNHACRYCGRTAPEVKLTVDHVIPEALGGSSDPRNLAAACTDCNGGKSATPPDTAHVAQVADDAVRWAAAVRAAAAVAEANLAARQDRHDEFLRVWQSYEIKDGGRTTNVPMAIDWTRAVDRFLTAGLTMPLLLECIPIAMSRSKISHDARFRYMCGIAWSRVTELQEAARVALGQKEAPKSDDWQHGRADLVDFGWFNDDLIEAGRALLAWRDELDEDEPWYPTDDPDVRLFMAIIEATTGEYYSLRLAITTLTRALPDGVRASLDAEARHMAACADESETQPLMARCTLLALARLVGKESKAHDDVLSQPTPQAAG